MLLQEDGFLLRECQELRKPEHAGLVRRSLSRGATRHGVGLSCLSGRSQAHVQGLGLNMPGECLAGPRRVLAGRHASALDVAHLAVFRACALCSAGAAKGLARNAWLGKAVVARRRSRRRQLHRWQLHRWQSHRWQLRRWQLRRPQSHRRWCARRSGRAMRRDCAPKKRRRICRRRCVNGA